MNLTEKRLSSKELSLFACFETGHELDTIVF